MSKTPGMTGDEQVPGTYEIRLRGHLDLRWAARLGVNRIIHLEDGTTILRGIAGDQSAVHGLLQRVRDLGLPLISVSRNDPETSG